MSNTIGNNDFYLFLAKQSDWKKEADTNNDDVITKNEFTVYLDNEFDWSNFDLNGKNKADLISNFFATLDTDSSGADEARLTTAQGNKISNKNALGAKEIEAANKQLEKYVALQESLTEAYKQCPSGIDEKKWKEIIKNLITTSFEQEPFDKKLTSEEIEKYAKQANIKYFVETSPNEIIKGYSNFAGHDLAGDENFTNLLKDFVENNSENWEAKDVEAAIKGFITNYLDGGNYVTGWVELKKVEGTPGKYTMDLSGLAAGNGTGITIEAIPSEGITATTSETKTLTITATKSGTVTINVKQGDKVISTKTITITVATTTYSATTDEANTGEASEEELVTGWGELTNVEGTPGKYTMDLSKLAAGNGKDITIEKTATDGITATLENNTLTITATKTGTVTINVKQDDKVISTKTITITVATTEASESVGEASGETKYKNDELFKMAVLAGLKAKTDLFPIEIKDADGKVTKSVNYNDYPNYFDKLFEDHTNNALKTATSHSQAEIKKAINAFEFDDTKIKTMIEEAEEEKQRLKDLEEITDKAVKDILDDYQDTYPFEKAIETIINGEDWLAVAEQLQLTVNSSKDALDNESLKKLTSYINKLIITKLDETGFNKDYEVTNLAGLESMHNARLRVIDGLEDKNSADDDAAVLQAYKDAAIDYCAWVNKSGNADYKKSLEEVFGKDYNTTINGLETVKDIQTKITELSNKLESIINPTDITVGYVNTSFSVQSGEAVSKKVIDDVDAGNKDITTGMTYNASCTDFKVSIVDGKLIFTAPTVTEDTSFEITIEPMYNGVSIGKTQKITITVKKPIDRDGVDWSKLKDNTDKSGKYDYYVGSVKGKNKDNNNTLTFEYMYNNSVNVAIVANEECTGQSSPTAVFTKANTQISNIANNLATIAKNNGCDETAANKAANKLKDLYKAAFNQYTFLGKKGDSGEKTVTYGGKTYTYYCGRADYEANVYGSYEADKGASASGLGGSLGLQVNMRAVGNNHYEIVLNMKRFMDLFNEFYKQALGS